jgi:hypothetical protein
MGMGMEELALLARRAFAQFQFINFLLFRRKIQILSESNTKLLYPIIKFFWLTKMALPSTNISKNVDIIKAYDTEKDGKCTNTY